MQPRETMEQVARVDATLDTTPALRLAWIRPEGVEVSLELLLA